MTPLPALAAGLLALPVLSGAADTGDAPAPSRVVNGPFEVRLTPHPATGAADGFARMSLDKSFHGPLEATGRGEMIAFRSATPGSAGYVALETVTGTLEGHAGSFVLQHSSTLARGQPTQSVTVVPDSGTGGLDGIAGRMTIDVGPGDAHAYRFEYTLPAARGQ